MTQDEILGRIRAVLDERDELRDENARLEAVLREYRAEAVKHETMIERFKDDMDVARVEINRLKDEIRKQDRIIDKLRVEKQIALGSGALKVPKPARVHIEASGNVVVTSNQVHPGDEGPVRETD